MDLSSIDPALLLASLMVAATPILLAALGELVVERAGVLNLGVEGMMITGAICGFAVAVNSGSPVFGFAAAAGGGALLALLFALLTQFALANQVASGLALTLFGLGLSALLGQGYVGIKPPFTPRLDIPVLSDIPFLGRVLFSHDLVVYLGLALTGLIWWMLRHSHAGMVLRLGEMYLIRSEALFNGATGTSTALDDINTLRDRASLAGLPGPLSLDDILNERRKELAFEGHRWYDLTRNNKGVEVLQNVTTTDQYLWPIPQAERDVNPNMNQNPGY